MKNTFINAIKLVIFLIVFIAIFFFIKFSMQVEKNNLVSYNGFLHLDGTSLCNKYNEPIQLKGVSSHGIQWFSDVITFDTLKQLRDDYGMNVFRVAVYTEENGYISQPNVIKNRVIDIIDICIDLDLYVVLDWHILNDGDPNTYLDESIEFFDEISSKYKNIPNILYEICNEPNGENITWDKIRNYANEVIPVIRKNNKNSIIIVGTPNWSKDIVSVADAPLDYKNIMYSCHFYSGSDDNTSISSIKYAFQHNVPVFVSEWGLTDLSGDGDLYFDNANYWLNFLDKKNISWIYWSFSNKDESSSILKASYDVNNFSSFSDFLTEAGKFILSKISNN